MKYIVTQSDTGIVELFMFPRHINHGYFAESLEALRSTTSNGRDWERIYRKPISAGFVSKDFKCYGRSESLNLNARPVEDTLLLRKQL